MKKHNPFASLLLLLLAVGVLGATVAGFIVPQSDTPVACQAEEKCGERCEEKREENLDFQMCWAVFEPLKVVVSHGCDPQFLVFTSPRTIAPVRSLGWRMPLRI